MKLGVRCPRAQGGMEAAATVAERLRGRMLKW